MDRKEMDKAGLFIRFFGDPRPLIEPIAYTPQDTEALWPIMRVLKKVPAHGLRGYINVRIERPALIKEAFEGTGALIGLEELEREAGIEWCLPTDSRYGKSPLLSWKARARDSLRAEINKAKTKAQLRLF